MTDLLNGYPEDGEPVMADTEINDTGTVRALTLTQMALVLALKVIDSIMSKDYDPEQADQDLRDLNVLREELGMEKD